MSEKLKIFCCLCNKEMFLYEGNNAEPVADGYCCAACNYEKVIPARIAEMEARDGKNK